jgi:hypothetical protein
VNPVHGSTVDRTKGVHPALIRSVHARSNDPGLVRAGRGGGHTGTESDAAACGGAPPVQPREAVPSGQNEHERVLRVSGRHASMPRGSGEGAGVHDDRRRKGAGRPRR